ncbi:MAG TPA: hypothetical protein VF581_06695 [Flavobacterium sp.]|jgi:hypothetical protein
MIRYLLVGLSLILSATANAQQEQEVSVEESLFGMQTGFLGFWAHNELRLTNEMALRTEIGFDTAVFGGALYYDTKYFLIPIIAAEPRWYYNLERRAGNDKNIRNNSGNFLTIKALYMPDWFLLTNDEVVKPINQLAFVPKYGMRRVYGEHFSFEAGLGIGVGFQFGKNKDYYSDTDPQAFVDLHLRIGYNF